MKKQFVIFTLVLALLLSGCAGQKPDTSLEVPPSTVGSEPTGTALPEPSGTNATEPSDPSTDPSETGESQPIEEQPVESTGPNPSQAPKPTEDEPKPTQGQPKPTEAPKPAHQHSYKAKTVAATCTEQGYTFEECSCGAKTNAHDYTSALGHDYQTTQTVEATPWSAGYTESVCSRCNSSNRTETGELTDAQLEAFRYDVAKATIKYINEYRVQEGSTELTYLPGLSQVAMYRSEQLITDFSHNVDQRQEAFTHFKYGYMESFPESRYDPETGEVIYTGNTISYYTCDENEAIGLIHLKSTADAMGKRIADNIHGSSGHWRYIGDAQYSYAGVGWNTEGYWVFFVSPVNYG